MADLLSNLLSWLDTGKTLNQRDPLISREAKAAQKNVLFIESEILDGKGSVKTLFTSDGEQLLDAFDYDNNGAPDYVVHYRDDGTTEGFVYENNPKDNDVEKIVNEGIMGSLDVLNYGGKTAADVDTGLHFSKVAEYERNH